MADSFVDSLIAKLTPSVGASGICIGSVNVSSSIALSLAAWLISNRANLEFVGAEAFHDFLDLFDRGRKEAAFQALLGNMNANAIIAQMNMDAAAELCAQTRRVQRGAIQSVLLRP